MSLTVIPAPPGTYVIERKQGEAIALLVPVIGFNHIQGGVCFPITVMPNAGLTRGRALITADGFVSDPSYGIVCTDKDEWMKLTKSPKYWEQPEPKATAAISTGGERVNPGEAESEIDQTELDAKINAKGDWKPKAIPDKPQRSRAPRVFKTNSFWHFQKGKKPDPAWDAVWMIPGGAVVPHEDDPVYKKITGEEFKALKKAGIAETDPRNVAGKPVINPNDLV